MCAWFAFGSLLVRVGGHDDEAVGLLTKARSAIVRNKNPALFLPAIDADLSTLLARAGRLDTSIEQLRTAWTTYGNTESPYYAAVPASALVTMLTSRGSEADHREAATVITSMERSWAHLDGTVMTLIILGAKAHLARAVGDGYAAAAQLYLEKAERFDARGVLSEARRMVDEAT